MTTRSAGTVDPQEALRVKHTRIGVWDLYEERQTRLSRMSGSLASLLETYAQILVSIPHVVHMLRDILSIKRTWILLPAFLVVEFFASLIPAVSLWYSGQLLRLVETAMETHTVDATVLVHVAVGHLMCKVTTRLLCYARGLILAPMRISIKQFCEGHILHSTVRLDLPTFEDSAVQGQLNSLSDWRIASGAIEESTRIVMMVIGTLSQLSVLFTVLRGHQDGPLFMMLGFLQSVILSYTATKEIHEVWAATTTNKDYIRMYGLKDLGNEPSHRKELIAGNLSEYVTAQFHESAQRVGADAGEFEDLHESHSLKKRLSIASILREIMHELPRVLGIDLGVDEADQINQIVFILHAIQEPTTALLSLASLMLIDHTSHLLIFTHFLPYKSSSLARQFDNVRKLYEISNVQNKVVDGTESFPEDQQSLRSGISVEFRNVSFQYPGAERYALQNVSFKIGAGQLCVIVGTNGSGKSTILNLISRIYDPTDGTILIDNRDIKTLRLADLRAAMSILFQDYTHFSLSIRENISLGNPVFAHDDDKVREAARLGGAEDFIDELPEGFDTYVNRPVRDRYTQGPQRPFDFSLVRSVGGLRVTNNLGLSGGQRQRLAVSRTFMRSLVTETEYSAGMLLFDEPSASLDPIAEHDLFERLRKLRSNKTMIFSTHRFGNLTRHADLILYMDESVQEQGTHDELMKKGGDYARIWNIQAQPFL
ncbi:P-loop containing nucleoside triphosphate hydrolase protein [Suillus ampliporus]|nr:P-loop containing nucleoside triphosphate hydrolase protein [Suillus ampliporus]